jgi:uncharacterized protein YdhG (YjbR/CyaY superfamily)
VSSPSAETIDGYIATFPKDVQSQLQKVRRTIAKAAPEAAEAISYRIPTFKFNGRYLTTSPASRRTSACTRCMPMALNSPRR